MIQFISDHLFLFVCILLFLFAAMFMFWELYKAPFEDIEDDNEGERREQDGIKLTKEDPRKKNTVESGLYNNKK